MNLAFIILAILGLIAVWFVLSFAFRPIGKFFYRFWKDVKDEISENDKEDENEDQER